MALVFEESGLRVTLPDGESFRFAQCVTYQGLSGRRIAEMDCGWWDGARQVICLLEVKDYSVVLPARELLPALIAKGRDCLVMLRGAWNEMGTAARDLKAELPASCRTEQRLRLFFVLKVGPAGIAREALGPMKDTLDNHVRAYAELLGFRSVVVQLLDHETAIRRQLPIAVA